MNPGARARRREHSSAVANADVAELLAREAEDAKPPFNRAFRRAARRAFLWPEEVFAVQAQKRSLTELQSVGPYIEEMIRTWLDRQPDVPPPPHLRPGFLTLSEADSILAQNPDWIASVKGDLQMHSVWSDGTASIAERAEAAAERGYEYIAIIDHAKSLKIAGGIDESQLSEQGTEIEAANHALEDAKSPRCYGPSS